MKSSKSISVRLSSKSQNRIKKETAKLGINTSQYINSIIESNKVPSARLEKETLSKTIRAQTRLSLIQNTAATFYNPEDFLKTLKEITKELS